MTSPRIPNPREPRLVVDPPNLNMGPNPPKRRKRPIKPPKYGIKPPELRPSPIMNMGPNLPKPRTKPGIPNGPTVGKAYKTY